MKPIVEANSLTYEVRVGFFLRKKALIQNFNFQIQAGESIGLVGANGAGKTTLIQLICGILKPTRGKMNVFGKNPHQTSVRTKIGYVPERPLFYPYLKVQTLLLHLARLSNLPKNLALERISFWLNEFEIQQIRDLKFENLSKGMQQKTGLIQALLHNPPSLICDEPMSGLDSESRSLVRNILKTYCANGNTIVMSSHSSEDVQALSTRVLRIENGGLQ